MEETLKQDKELLTNEHLVAKEAEEAAKLTQTQEFEQRIGELEEENKRLSEEKESSALASEEAKKVEEEEKAANELKAQE